MASLPAAPAAAPAPPPAAQPPALAHVFLTDAGVDLSQEDLSQLAYDDATGQLVAVKGGHVFAYSADGGALRWMYPLQVCVRACVRVCVCVCVCVLVGVMFL